MDNSTFGVIYFSLSLVNIKSLSENVKEIFVDVFSKLNQTVLWNFEEEDLDVSRNVIIRKWFRRNDVLGHKNVRLFITDGDNLSIQEAMFHGIPVVGIPLLGDQHGNLAKIVNKNLGIKLNYLSLSVDLVYDTVMEALYNPMYRKNMEQLATKFKDQPQTPSDRAVFWIEYALRNKNLDHLNIAAKYMGFYETMSLDIMLLAAVCVLLLFFAFHTIYQLIYTGVHPPKIKRKSAKQKEL